ncbi:hypothetical protein [Nesterenkonia pannonica]|uniref:hypothetical protein n=1 Tax=Nesterenkonia pannonica TaxID=1548602 RepID=UPI002164581C|nr:hypothetical protein [Nesterenkonia pannonica]
MGRAPRRGRGRTAPHAEIAKITFERMPEHMASRGWWAQGAAIAYEHERGLRVPGQSHTGDFSASASKTVHGDKDAALARLLEVVAGMQEFGGVPAEERPTASSTDTWRYWRVKLADGTRADVTISEKSPGKAVVAVQHSRLPTQDEIPRWKSFWKELLAQF